MEGFNWWYAKVRIATKKSPKKVTTFATPVGRSKTVVDPRQSQPSHHHPTMICWVPQKLVKNLTSLDRNWISCWTNWVGLTNLDTAKDGAQPSKANDKVLRLGKSNRVAFLISSGPQKSQEARFYEEQLPISKASLCQRNPPHHNLLLHPIMRISERNIQQTIVAWTGIMWGQEQR